ncbi:hypothetical protein [Streptomyces diastatochromogenes]|uniref:hypothetical protein n=1 Tax=Streptomyces diastatochromogenes TaxID=42236 RepID=UPI0036C8825B
MRGDARRPEVDLNGPRGLPRPGAAFAERLTPSGRRERRYRFAAPCAEDGCAQWTGRRCGVIDHILDDPPDPGRRSPPAEGASEGSSPLRWIRAGCRWFALRGAAACGGCATVVAGIRGCAAYRSAHPVQRP